jgi:dienelactone hydrolase
MMKEATVCFGPDGALVGTHAYAVQGNSAFPGLAVLLTNAGLIDRTGPHGMNVRLARAFAAVGIPSLRFDLSGIGDSQRPSNPLATEPQYIADTRQALDEAQARHGVSRFVMIGFCSGADLAHLAALEDSRLVALLLWDPYIYPTLKSRAIYLVDRVREFGLFGAFRRALLRLAARLRSSTGPGTDSPEGQAAAPQGRYGRAYIPPAREYAFRLRQLVDRGVRILAVYSGGFRSDYNYETQYRDSFRGCAIVERVQWMFLPAADHTLTTRRAQQDLVRIAVDWVRGLDSSGAHAPSGPLS